MKVRFYIAPQQGDGTFLDPFRSILNDFIDIAKGEWFDEIDHPARRISICCVHALDETHGNIGKDGKVIIVSPLTDEKELSKILDMPFSEIKDIADSQTLEGIGIDASWVKDNTLKDVLQHIMKLFSAVQIADGEGEQEVKEFLSKNISATVDSVSSTVSNKVTQWIDAKGIDITSIGAKTTVKDISKILVDNMNGKLKMSGEEF
jgi:gas vesicle protein